MTCVDPTTLELAHARLRELVEHEQLLDARVEVRVEPLSPEEAIGSPQRRDFPIAIGKERMIEAIVLGARGQAFTDSPRELVGTVGQVLDRSVSTSPDRAVLVATLNAVLAHLGRVTATVHCKDEEPEMCAREIAAQVLERHGRVEVGLVGLNPAILERLVDVFGADHVRITDLNMDNVGTTRFGVQIWNGDYRTEDLISASDILLVTGTTLVNDTFDRIRQPTLAAKKHFVPYGVTAAGVCELMGIDRICPRGRM